MTLKLKRGDLLPDLVVTLTDDDVPVDLTTASSLKVIGYKDGQILFSRSTTGTAQGVVTMSWQAADTATPGEILVEVEVTWPGSKPQSFPPDDYLRVRVGMDLG